jgi:hypothetical protein
VKSREESEFRIDGSHSRESLLHLSLPLNEGLTAEPCEGSMTLGNTSGGR